LSAVQRIAIGGDRLTLAGAVRAAHSVAEPTGHWFCAAARVGRNQPPVLPPGCNPERVCFLSRPAWLIPARLIPAWLIPAWLIPARPALLWPYPWPSHGRSKAAVDASRDPFPTAAAAVLRNPIGLPLPGARLWISDRSGLTPTADEAKPFAQPEFFDSAPF